MSWSVLNFGKHKGKSLPQVVFQDLDWFFWAFEEGVFKGIQKSEAEKIYRKARSIRIPQNGSEILVAEYGISPFNGTFVDLELVPKNRPQHEGSTKTFRRNVIDLSVPRDFKEYDKIGSKLLLSKVKFYLLGDSKHRMTKRQCEDFFDDDNNFEI